MATDLIREKRRAISKEFPDRPIKKEKVIIDQGNFLLNLFIYKVSFLTAEAIVHDPL
jgi:hypothetical protein